MEPNPCPDPIPPFYVPEKIRVALVLGSGGVRGMAHVGAIETLVNAGIPIDLIVGCSAGSIVGALYADNPNIEDIKCAVWKLNSDTILDFNLWDCRWGLSKGKSLSRILDEDLQAETFEELQIPMIIVACDLHTGDLIPMGSGELVPAIRSSCSIPVVFVPCNHMGRVLVDGGTINPVPARVAWDLGAEVIIAVDLCELLDSTLPSNLVGVFSRSAEIAFMWQNEVCTRDADVIIRPKTCGVGAFNDHMKWQVYESGRLAAEDKLEEIRKLIAEKNINICEPPAPRTRLVHLQAYTPAIYLDTYDPPEFADADKVEQK